jgi:RNA polymerase sigma-70 factor (ECF subfamily)
MLAATPARPSTRPARTTRRSTAQGTNARAKKNVPVSPAQAMWNQLGTLRPDLFAHAVRLTRSPQEAEDLVQDTVMRAFSFQENFQHGTNLRAWTHQIMISIFMSACRRRKLERLALELLTVAPCAWPRSTPRPEMTALTPGMTRAMEALPLAFRAPLILVDVEEMAYKDAATLLGVPVGTVMSRLSRARHMLADAVREATPVAA